MGTRNSEEVIEGNRSHIYLTSGKSPHQTYLNDATTYLNDNKYEMFKTLYDSINAFLVMVMSVVI